MICLKLSASVLLLWMWVPMALGVCSIPAHLQGKWNIEDSYTIRIRQHRVIYRDDNTTTTLDCVANDRGRILLKDPRTVEDDDDTVGVACLLIDEMADAGYTIQRLDPRGSTGDILSTQNQPSDTSLTLENICHGNENPFDFVFMKRAPNDSQITNRKREPTSFDSKSACVFPKRIRGTWSSSLDGVDFVKVGKRSFAVTFLDKQVTEFVCDEKRRRQFLLRTHLTFSLTVPQVDGFICVKMLFRQSSSGLDLLFTKHGDLWNNTIKIVPYKKPLSLPRDCSWERAKNNSKALLMKMERVL